ncbi:hypothetical protein K4K58_001556 [Colletotrichum sp. SAR11_239]|nr:hypothetical protein K4K58_001556 [Colletotrichum sp. SAR11_239]
MSEKGGRWNNVEFVTSLMMSFYNELKGDGLSKEKKDAIEVRLRGQGFEDVTWNGIRLLDASSPLSTSSLVDPPYSSSRSSSSSVITRLFQTATMSRNVMRWTPEVDQQILIALIKAINPTAEQYDTVLQNLQPCGYNFTVSALNISPSLTQQSLPFNILSSPSPQAIVTSLHQLITMSRHYQKWTPEIDQQILAAMVKVMIPTAEQYNAIMEGLEPCGYGFTAITMK